MKFSYLLILTMLAYLPVSAQVFEGTVTVTHSQKPTQVITYSASDRLGCMDIINNGVPSPNRMVNDIDLGKYAIIVNQNGQNTAMHYTHGGTRSANPAASMSNVQLTGSTQLIQGYQCVEVTATLNGQAYQAWVATALDYIDPTVFIIPTTSGVYSDFKVAGVPGFVLEMTTSNPITGATYTLTNTVQIQTVDPAILVIP